MSNHLPAGLRELFTADELKDFCDSEWKQVPSKQCSKGNKGLLAQGTSKIKTTRTSLHMKKWNCPPTREIKINPIALKSTRKKLFKTDQVQSTKANSKPNVIRGLKRKSTSLLNLSDIENETHFKLKRSFYTKPQQTIENKDSDNVNSTRKLSNRLSSGEKEFIEIEKSFREKNQKKEKDLQIKIETILLDDNKKFLDLKRKFEEFSQEHDENMKRIKQLLMTFSNSDVDVSNTSKKKVAFAETFHASVDIPEDRGLEKAVNMYNSIRKNYDNILVTPQLNRRNLQTPKSSMKQEGLSRKLQKQCLLLLDTPAK